MAFYQLFHLILHEIDRFGCLMLKSGFFQKSLVLCLKKNYKLQFWSTAIFDSFRKLSVIFVLLPFSLLLILGRKPHPLLGFHFMCCVKIRLCSITLLLEREIFQVTDTVLKRSAGRSLPFGFHNVVCDYKWDLQTSENRSGSA